MTSVIPAAVLKQHSAYLGKTGSGKTSTAKIVVEQILAEAPSARVCILDPIKSDWWGLTSSADGKRPGLPFHILGGPRGHVPLHSSAGKAIGELVATGALPLSIIDMADFPAGGLQEFFNDFVPALMKRMRGVVHLVLEEAHEFAPKERAGFGAENMAIHNAKKLATAGRSKGIRLMLLTQRTQSLHNALLGSCDTIVAHRLTAPADQKPVLDWLKANFDMESFKKVASSLASLRTGSGWLCAGEGQIAELVHFPKITTYDNSATPTADSGDHDVRTAPVDVDHLRKIIGQAADIAASDDPAKLRAEIARLNGLLANGGARADISKDELNAAEQRGYQDARQQVSLQLIDQVAQYGRELQAEFHALEGRLLSRAAQLRIDVAGSYVSSTEYKPGDTVQTPAGKMQAVQPPPRAPRPHAANGSLNSAGQKMLAVLDTNPPVKRTWRQTATLAGIRARGGHFNTGKKGLIDFGLIKEDGDLISVASPSAGAAKAKRKPDELVQMWCGSLSGAAPKILRDLFQHGGKSTIAAVADRLDMQPRGGHWNTGWKELKDNDIVRVNGGVAELTELFR